MHETSGRMHIGATERGWGGQGLHRQAGPCHVESTPTAVTNCLLSRCLSCPLAASGVWRGDPSGVSSRPRVIRRGRVSVGASVIYRAACCAALRLASYPASPHPPLPPSIPLQIDRLHDRPLACTPHLPATF